MDFSLDGDLLMGKARSS